MFRTHDSISRSDLAIGGQAERNERIYRKKEQIAMSQYPDSYALTPSMGMLCDFSMIDVVEDMSSQDVIRATVHDFNRTVGKLKKNRSNVHYLQHLLDLIVFMRQDDCFCFMEPDRETFIAVILYELGMTFQDLIGTLGRSA